MNVFQLAVCLIVGLLSQNSISQTVYKCKTPAGEVIYSDRECGSDSEEILIETIQASESSVSALAPSLPSQPEESSMNPSETEPADTLTEPYSFRCVAADGEIWYTHDFCPNTIKRIGSRAQVVHFIDGDRTIGIQTERYVPVEQFIVSTKDACENGAGNDSKLYNFSHSTCSFVGSQLRLQAQIKQLEQQP